jgi:hypothetical protein
MTSKTPEELFLFHDLKSSFQQLNGFFKIPERKTKR